MTTRDLTELDIRILQLMADGLSNVEIAAEIHYAPGSLSKGRGVINKLYKRLDVPDTLVPTAKRTYAVATAFRAGIIK